jgi:hypothetical protein
MLRCCKYVLKQEEKLVNSVIKLSNDIIWTNYFLKKKRPKTIEKRKMKLGKKMTSFNPN